MGFLFFEISWEIEGQAPPSPPLPHPHIPPTDGHLYKQIRNHLFCFELSPPEWVGVLGRLEEGGQPTAFAPSGLVFSPAAHRGPTESLPRQSLFFPQQHTEHFVIQWYIEKPWNKRKSVILFSLSCTSLQTKMRFSKIANLVNAPAIHNQKIVVRTFQIPPAAHRAHTEPLRQQPRQGLFSPQQPTEPPQSLCPDRGCFSPAAHRALCYPMVYIKTVKKTEIGYPFFHSAAHSFQKNAVFENCKFSKRARNT